MKVEVKRLNGVPIVYINGKEAKKDQVGDLIGTLRVAYTLAHVD